MYELISSESAELDVECPMTKLPLASGAEAVKTLCRLGFSVDCQRGSHVVLKMAGVSSEKFSDAL